MALRFSRASIADRMLVLCGPSGSGKSTWVRQYAADYELISLDLLREEVNGDRACQKNIGKIIHLAKDRLKDCLRRKVNVVWDATNLRKDFRQIIIDIAEAYHGLVTIVNFLLPETTLLKADRDRTYSVGPVVLQSQIESYQFPLVDEAHRYIVVTEGGIQSFRSGFV